jgi:hypothetical protein
MVTLRVRSMVWFATGVVLTLLATVLVMQTWRADAAPGDEDSTYVPIANCRLFDFRSGINNVGPKNTPLGSGEANVYTQSVHGPNGDCNIPSDAVGVAMNVTIVNPTAQSNLRIFPADIATPNTSNLNWLPGQSPTPNKVDVKLSSDGKIKLYNHAGTVNVLADVVGYYTKTSLQELATGLATANANIAASDSKIAALEAAEPFSVSNFSSDELQLISTPISVLNVSLTAPVDGRVTVNYSTFIQNLTAGGVAVCAPFRSTEIPVSIDNHPGQGWWQTADATFGFNGSISGTASFDISAETTVTYSLACQEQSGTGKVDIKTVTAIFTPTP